MDRAAKHKLLGAAAALLALLLFAAFPAWEIWTSQFPNAGDAFSTAPRFTPPPRPSISLSAILPPPRNLGFVGHRATIKLQPVQIPAVTISYQGSASPQIGAQPGHVDPLQLALHPSQLTSGSFAVTQLLRSDSPEASAYQEALRLESARQFVMSMCTDLRGDLWVGTEGGGVQRFNPSAPKWHEWTQFTTKDGLGDDCAYAIACDHQGRIWVGHLNHGVSVFNGQKWQNYDVVAGLDGPDSLSGPLGERIFHIAVCPTDGDIWIATNAGLTRYSPTSDAWRYYTRADGLPSDATDAIAFDPTGNVYVGTQCDGIAIAKAADGYHNWRQIIGPDQEPTVPAGPGVPSNLINDILITRDGTVFAATDSGLAWSHDQGKSWAFTRGQDWAEKVRNSVSGPPHGWIDRTGAPLAEDYVTRLFQDQTAQLIIGYRQYGWERFDLNGSKIFLGGRPVAQGGALYVTSFTSVPDGRLFVGTYGQGAIQLISPRAIRVSKAAAQEAFPVSPMPSSAKPPDLAQLNRMNQQLSVVPPANQAATPFVTPLDDDWLTEGTWLGRYGRYWCWLAAMGDYSQGYIWGTPSEPISHSIKIAKTNRVAGEIVRHWIAQPFTDQPSALEVPLPYLHRNVLMNRATWKTDRQQGEWDDHGESYSRTFDGPDLDIVLSIPAGLYILSVYEVNDDAHVGPLNRERDFELIISGDPVGRSRVVRERIVSFFGGVYKKCLVRGPQALNILIRRNFSLNTIFNAVMLDELGEYIPPYNLATTRQPDVGSAHLRKEFNAGSNAEIGPSERMQDDAILRSMAQLSMQNPYRWAIYRNPVARFLARALYDRHGQDARTETLVCRDRTFSLYQSSLFKSWEDNLESAGSLTSRTIEKSLRWDGITGVESGHEAEYVRNYVQSKFGAAATSSALQQ